MALHQTAIGFNWEALGPQRHCLIKPHMLAYNAGFPDDHASAMINKETLIYAGTRCISMPVAEWAISVMMRATSGTPN